MSFLLQFRQSTEKSPTSEFLEWILHIWQVMNATDSNTNRSNRKAKTMTNDNTKTASFLALITANVDAFISDYSDPQDVALACKTVARKLTREQVSEAYADAVARGLAPETPKKRRYVAKAMARLIAMGNDSAWNLLPRKALRQIATRHGVVVGNGRAKANFVRTLALVAA